MNGPHHSIIGAGTGIVGALTFLGCGGDDAGQESGDLCADLYVAGAVVSTEDVQVGCELADGSTLVANSIECADGTVLVTFEDSDPQLWGFTGSPLHEASGGENASDPDYANAYDRCGGD